MPKAPRHRKRVRTARLEAAAQPLGGATTTTTSTSNGDGLPPPKKVGKKEAEVTSLIDKLRSDKIDERIWASAALSGMLLDLPAVTLRLLLSKNLVGILIERLNDEEDQVVVECLGTLRNLAITQPPSLLSEMFNKRLLHPLTNRHLPLLSNLLPSLFVPFQPVPYPLPASPDARASIDLQNSKLEMRRRLFWDWAENVLVLLSCLSESTTRILGALNAVKEELVQFCAAFLNEQALGFEIGEGKGKKKSAGKKDRVPMNVALAAAQTLHSFLSTNSPARPLLTPSIPSLSLLLSTPSFPFPAPTSDDKDDFVQLRVLAFGILLGSKKKHGVREVLEAHVAVLLEGLGTDLSKVAVDMEACVKRVGVEAPSNPELLRTEKQLSTLQLSLEVLGEWVASLDLPASTSSRRPALEKDDEGGIDVDDDEEEEWGGIVDVEGDTEMDDDSAELDDDDAQDEAMAEEGEVHSIPRVILSKDARELCSSLPPLLLRLATPTSLSFITTSTTSPTPLPDLIPTTAGATPQPSLPAPLHALSETLTTIHVRALECLNNLLITVASSPSPLAVLSLSLLQSTWEQSLGAVQTASEGAGSDETVQERRKEVVGAGTGVAWGVARIGLEAGLIVGPSTTPFLVALFGHAFAAEATPAGEAIRVRITGILGCIGRRASVPDSENAEIGNLLLSILPLNKAPSPLTPTPDVLLQAIDALIDLYADEEASYDGAVFRAGGFLDRLDGAVAGVRAAAKKIDRKKFPELRARADGALENLIAFVKYRKDVA